MTQQYTIKFTAIPKRKYSWISFHKEIVWTKVFVFGDVEIHVPDVAGHSIFIRYTSASTEHELGVITEHKTGYIDAD